MAVTTVNQREEIIRFLRVRPFASFKIVLTDGRKFPIVRLLQIAVGEQVAVLFPADGGVSVTFKIDQVQSVEAL